MVVVDACAVAAVLFGEPDAEVVVDRIGAAPLAAPGLLWYELASVCLKKRSAHPRAAKKLLRMFALLDHLNIAAVAVDHAETVQLAQKHRMTTYDASYLWLARYLRVPLITLDQRLQHVASDIL